MNLTFNLPINSVSFGVTSLAILREIFNRREETNLFPIGQVDMSAQRPFSEFSGWLQNTINNSVLKHTKNTPVLRLWHILQSLESVVSKNNNLFTFHETSQITEIEKNILNQQDKVFVSSPYTKQVFESGGVTVPIILCPLGFDSYNLYKKNKKFYNDGRIVWGLNGKMEKRKSTFKILNLWAKKYGNNKNHILHCLINNNFIDPQVQNNLIGQALEGKQYWNINFLPYQGNLEGVCDILNAQTINLDGLALTEGWNYGLFNSLCLGKKAIVLNAHVHKQYCNEKNSILVEPKGMIPAEDGFFFKKDNIINQGEWFSWSENDVSDAMDLAVSQSNIPNADGEKLKEIYTWEKTVKIIENNIS